ncbi:MAG: hypothetical protein ABGX16_12825 [Pirellulales bacterium]
MVAPDDKFAIALHSTPSQIHWNAGFDSQAIYAKGDSFLSHGSSFNTWEILGSPQNIAEMIDLHFQTFIEPSIIPTTSADFDINGHVDGNDFLKWQRGESPNPLSRV